MSKPVVYTRPTFDQAQDAWKHWLSARGFSPDCLWLFEENLCFENGPKKDQLKLCYQTKFTPPPPDSHKVAYNHFIDSEAPIVFYRIGSSHDKSLCVLLCDPWFSTKTAAEGFDHRDDWLILFHPGKNEEVEEITSAARWKKRIVKRRPLHDLDFSMTLRAVHETLAHGRILSSYEHYALRFLHTWSEFDHETGSTHGTSAGTAARARTGSGKNGLDNQNRAS